MPTSSWWDSAATHDLHLHCQSASGVLLLLTLRLRGHKHARKCPVGFTPCSATASGSSNIRAVAA